jgi:hypothetical protein
MAKPRRKRASVAKDLSSLTVSQLAMRLEEIQTQLSEYEELKAEETAIADALRRRIPGASTQARNGRHGSARTSRSRGSYDWESVKSAVLGQLQKGTEYSTGELRELAGVPENATQSFYKQVVVPLYEAGAIKWNQQARRASRY